MRIFLVGWTLSSHFSWWITIKWRLLTLTQKLINLFLCEIRSKLIATKIIGIESKKKIDMQMSIGSHNFGKQSHWIQEQKWANRTNQFTSIQVGIWSNIAHIDWSNPNDNNLPESMRYGVEKPHDGDATFRVRFGSSLTHPFFEWRVYCYTFCIG